MALTDENLTMEFLSNPINLQYHLLSDLNDRLEGNMVLVDPNSTAVFLMEMFANNICDLATACENTTSGLVATRAQTAKELYKHMSDYDYVNLFGSPSTATVYMVLDKDYLVNNALDYNDQYKKVIIPKETVFKIGTLEFGIFYPIEIRINKSTNSVVCVWDTTDEFPSQTLDSNSIPFIESFITPYTLLQLQIPIYQFSLTSKKEALTSDFGFSKSYTYKNKFYMVRLFTIVNGVTIELSQTLSEGNYDPYTATARIIVDPEASTLGINIPQIYFSTGMVGTSLYLEIYTTKGDLSTDISQITIDEVSTNFNLTSASSEYSTCLSRISLISLAPISTNLSGGSDGYSLAELRERVINSSFHTSLLVTPDDLENYFEDLGMKIVKYKDDLTNLMYFAYKSLVDSESNIIPSSNTPIKIDLNSIENVSTIINSDDGTITIMPNTTYLYDEGLDSAIPLTDAELSNINALDNESKCTMFNENVYMRSPFHIRLVPDSKYTVADCYNLINPSINSFKFDKENDNVTAQMVISQSEIVHMDSGTGSYKLRVGVNKSADLINIAEDHVVVYLSTVASNGSTIGIQMSFVGITSSLYIYEADITTDYNIDRDNNISISNLTNDSETWDHYVALEQSYSVTFLVKYDYFPTAIQDSDLIRTLPSSITGSYLGMTRQTFNIKLGSCLSDTIYNNVDMHWSSQSYKTHEVAVPLTYTETIFETDDSGVPVYEIVDGEVKFTILHNKGDVVYNDTNEIMYKYKVGDIMCDDFGNQIVDTERALLYYIEAPMIDAKFYQSQQTKHVEYVDSIPSIIESYLTTIETAKDNLLERDDIYFKLIKTLGTSSFGVGNNLSMTLPINMSVSLRCHVDESTLTDETILTTIRELIVEIIETAFLEDYISLVDIANTITESISYIESIDVLGLCGNDNLQTITVTEDSVQPSLAQSLYITDNGDLSIQKDLDLEFISSS